VSFTGNGYKITEARFYLQRIGSSPTAQFKVNIYAKPSSGYTPLTTLLASSQPVDFNAIPTNNGWVSFNFTGNDIFTTVPGQTYIVCIVCTASGLSNMETGSPYLNVCLKDITLNDRRAMEYFNKTWHDFNTLFYLFQVIGVPSNGGGGSDLTVTGNLTVNGNATFGARILANAAQYQQTRDQLNDHLYHVGYNPPPLEYDWSSIPQYIRFGNSSDANACLFCIKLTDGANEPILYWNRGFAARKDIIAGGRLDTQEGVLSMLGGVGFGPSTGNPFVWLVGNHYSYPEKDTLEIRISTTTSNVWIWGKLACGDINIGDRGYLADVGENNIIGIQGKTDRSVGGFKFGNGSGKYYHKLFVEGNYLMYYCNGGLNPCGFMPYDGNQNLGGSQISGHPYPWRHIFGRWIHAYDQILCNNKTIGSYDSLDDLGIIKNIKSIRVKSEIDGIARDVVDFSKLEFLQIDKESISINNTIGFLIGVCKFLALKIDELEAKIEKNSGDKK
jgi:hypothetical protein